MGAAGLGAAGLAVAVGGAGGLVGALLACGGFGFAGAATDFALGGPGALGLTRACLGAGSCMLYQHASHADMPVASSMAIAWNLLMPMLAAHVSSIAQLHVLYSVGSGSYTSREQRVPGLC